MLMRQCESRYPSRVTDDGPVGASRLLVWGPLVIALVVIVSFFVVWFSIRATPGDAYNYLAAGERLNAGHPLYQLSAGDRAVELHPPYWTVPFLSPPLLGVIWRPLAALPHETGVAIWWMAGVVTMISALAAMAVKKPLLVGLSALILSIDMVYALGMGNVDPFLFAGVNVLWLLYRSRRLGLAAVLVGVMVAVKVTPAILAIWLIAVAPGKKTIMSIGAAVLVGVAIGIVGAGPTSTETYLSVMRSTESSGVSPLSVSGLTGLALATPAVALLCAFASIALRRRPAWSFALAVCGYVLGNPSLHIGSVSQLLALLAPWCWPLENGLKGEETRQDSELRLSLQVPR